MLRRFAPLVLFALLIAPAAARAQGLLVVIDPDRPVRLPRPYYLPPEPRTRPEPVESYKIKSLEVQARLVDQVANVQVSQTFVNTGSGTLEVSFCFPLPYDGAIDSMTLLVDGKEYPARLLAADEARRTYESIVRKNRDPALLEWIGTGMFQTSVFPVPPGAARTVTLRYSQLLRKAEGLTDFLFPLSTAKYTSRAIEKIEIRATIESGEEIKNVYSPTHEVKVKRADDEHATITYTAENEVPSGDFRLLYDVGKGQVSTRVLSYRPDDDEDGYFLLLATPEIKSATDEPPKKNVVFVIDRSGSMSGQKIEQARGAAKFLVENLHEGDIFNIVAYDSTVEAFRPELERYNDESRKAALGFIEGLYAGGSTNIDDALRTSLGQLEDSSRPSYVLFMTDGLPTTGVTSEGEIVARAKQANDVRARVFSFGVGYDVNSRLLDRLARDNFGYSEYVRPNEDIEDRVSRLFRRIESPVMTDVELAIELDEAQTEDGKLVNRLYPKGAFDLFAGEQLVAVGRYKRPGDAKVTVRGSVGGKKQKLDFPAKLVRHSKDETNAFVEKLWAVRRVGEILDELDLKGRNEELVRELVDLATQHGILTPYTSFLADENTNLHDTAANAAAAGVRLRDLEESSGYYGFEQRALKGGLQRAEQGNLALESLSDSYDAAATAPAGAIAGQPSAPAQAMGGGAGGYGSFGRRGSIAQQQSGQASSSSRSDRDAATEGQIAADKPATENVRQVGNRAFYRRGEQWFDATLTEAQQKKFQRVKQFSDDYFALAKKHGRDLAQYLVFDEPVLLNLEGEAYLIEP